MVKPAGSARGSKERPAARWSQYTTVKASSRAALVARNSPVALMPGPPCRRIRTGFATLRPRIITHCATPPRVRNAVSAMESGAGRPSGVVNGAVRPAEAGIVTSPRRLRRVAQSSRSGSSLD